MAKISKLAIKVPSSSSKRPRNCFRFDGIDRRMPVELFVKLVDLSSNDGDQESHLNFAKNRVSEQVWTSVKESNSDECWQRARQFLLDQFGQKNVHDLIDCLHLLSSLVRLVDEDPMQHLLRVKFCVDKIEALAQSSDDLWLKLLYLQNLTLSFSEIEDNLNDLLKEVDNNLAVLRKHAVMGETINENSSRTKDPLENKTEPTDFEFKVEIADDPLCLDLKEDSLNPELSDHENWFEDLTERKDEFKPKKKAMRKMGFQKARCSKSETAKDDHSKTGFVPGQSRISWDSIKDVDWENPMYHQIIRSKDPSKKFDYICAICVRQGKKDLISGRNEFSQHCRNHHKGNTLICDSCDYSTKILDLLVSHRYVKHKKITAGFEKMHTCPKEGCNKKFVTKLELHKHVYKHAGVTEKGVCPICGKVVADKYRVKEHIDKVHKKLRKEQCDICQKWFQEPSYLKKHKAFVHRVGRPEAYQAICDICGKVCLDKAMMVDHVKRVHQKLLRNKCSDCDKKFYSKAQLRRHQMSVHKLSNKFVCPHCGLHKGNSNSLKVHVDSVHLNKKHFHCRSCDSWFTASYTLAFHIATRHLGFSQTDGKKPENLALARNNDAFERVKDEDAMIGNPLEHQKSKAATPLAKDQTS